MPLTPSAKRRLRHTRQVSCQGFEREDGLWDIDAHLIDTKDYDIDPEEGGRPVSAGDPIHSMFVRLTIDTGMVVRGIEVSMDHTPYTQCPSVEAAFQTIVGETIGKGWKQMVRSRLGGVNGCTHIVELLGPIATTAYQSLYKVLHESTGAVPLNGCHAWADDGKLVKEFYPQFYQQK